jgi:hypothetical protein
MRMRDWRGAENAPPPPPPSPGTNSRGDSILALKLDKHSDWLCPLLCLLESPGLFALTPPHRGLAPQSRRPQALVHGPRICINHAVSPIPHKVIDAWGQYEIRTMSCRLGMLSSTQERRRSVSRENILDCGLANCEATMQEQ